MEKLYCYVDETGQDTKDKLFLVSVVLKRKEQLEILRTKLERAEQLSGKKSLKWLKTNFASREAYLAELTKIGELRKAIYYSYYESSKEYHSLISLTVAKSITFQKMNPYEATIIIDGLNMAETDKVRRHLKGLGIKYRKIRGMRDEQEILLRLADSMAGFLRDWVEGQKYTEKYMSIFLREQLVVEV